jgi:hypothetical protein
LDTSLSGDTLARMSEYNTEPPKRPVESPVVTLRMPPAMLRRLNAMIGTSALTRSELIRSLINAQLRQEDGR